MHAEAAKKAHHESIRYQVVRVPDPRPDALWLWDGVLVLARTEDEAADIERARKHLEANGLLDCTCCSVESGL